MPPPLFPLGCAHSPATDGRPQTPDRQPARSSHLSSSLSGRAEPLAFAGALIVAGALIATGIVIVTDVVIVPGAISINFVVGLVAIVGIIALAVGSNAVRNADHVGSDRRYASRSILRKAGRLLPAADREEYIEEWRSWLSDMRETGEPWYRRLVELLGIALIAAPRLAITLKLGRRVAD